MLVWFLVDWSNFSNFKNFNKSFCYFSENITRKVTLISSSFISFIKLVLTISLKKNVLFLLKQVRIVEFGNNRLYVVCLR